MRSVSGEQVRDATIDRRAAFDFVRYANCWEDADLLVAALQPEPGKRMLSIASAGDNSLALLAEGADVVAVDLSTAQLHCLELRCAGFRRLEYDDLLGFLGVRESDHRLKTYQLLENELSESARIFWARHHAEVANGIIHMGKFEAYFRTFRTKVLPWIHTPQIVNRLFEPGNEADRVKFWNSTWNNWRWRILLRVFFSRFLMARLGRDREFFRFVEGSISEQVQRRARYAMTTLAPDQNPFLQYIALGNYQTALPRYLREDKFHSIREGLVRLRLVHGPIEKAAVEERDRGFDGMNLSDVFEYVSGPTARGLYTQLLPSANAGARIVYWNAFVPRSCPEELLEVVTPLVELSRELFLQDKAFFYSHFRVDEVTRSIQSFSTTAVD